MSSLVEYCRQRERRHRVLDRQTYDMNIAIELDHDWCVRTAGTTQRRSRHVGGVNNGHELGLTIVQYHVQNYVRPIYSHEWFRYAHYNISNT